MSKIHIAEGPGDESITVPQLFAGDTPHVTTRDVLFKAAQGALPQYTPLSWDGVNGNYIAWAAGAAIAAVTCYDVPDQAVDQRAAVYVAGNFNIDAILWPAGTTEEQVHAAMVASGANSMLQFRKLLYSGERVADGGLLVGPGNQPPPES